MVNDLKSKGMSNLAAKNEVIDIKRSEELLSIKVSRQKEIIEKGSVLLRSRLFRSYR